MSNHERPPASSGFVEQMLALLPAGGKAAPRAVPPAAKRDQAHGQAAPRALRAAAKRHQELRTRLATAAPEDVARLLSLAGYAADRVPLEERLAALHVVWCLEKGVFDSGEIARFVGRGRAYARAVRTRVRGAKR